MNRLLQLKGCCVLLEADDADGVALRLVADRE